VEDGQLRFLGYFGSSAPSAFPDVPTFVDLGYDVVWDQPYGMGAPAGIPEEAKEKLAAAAERVWAKSEFGEELANLGLEVYDATGEEMREALLEMQAGITRVLEILRASN
jgi:tripartite-type tricarboxylate transporter receptor subunit TctC